MWEKKERALIPAEAEFSFNQNSGRAVRVEIICCGEGAWGCIGQKKEL